MPLGHEPIVGLMAVGGRTAVLADLCLCLGHGAIARGAPGVPLVIRRGQDGEQDTGFFAESIVGTATPVGVYPVSRGLRWAGTFAFAAFEGHGLVPLVDPAPLLALAIEGAWAPPRMKPLALEGLSGGSTRMVRIRGGMAVLDHAGDVAEAELVRLPVGPRGVAGLALVEDRMVAVLGRMDGGGRMMVCAFAGTDLGVAVDEDLGAESGEVVEFSGACVGAGFDRAMRTPWGLLPVLGPGAFVVDAGKAARQPCVRGESCSGEFGRKALNVLEVSIGGSPFALPKAHVAGVREYRGVSPMPGMGGLCGLVHGIVGHGDGALVVLDLACAVGGRSHAGPGWSLVEIADGEFHAMLVVMDVKGEALLKPGECTMAPVLEAGCVMGTYEGPAGECRVLDIPSLAAHGGARELGPIVPVEALAPLPEAGAEPDESDGLLAALKLFDPEAMDEDGDAWDGDGGWLLVDDDDGEDELLLRMMMGEGSAEGAPRYVPEPLWMPGVPLIGHEPGFDPAGWAGASAGDALGMDEPVEPSHEQVVEEVVSQWMDEVVPEFYTAETMEEPPEFRAARSGAGSGRKARWNIFKRR
jgi:hypothetical protein